METSTTTSVLKQSLLQRLSYAVTSSILSHVILVFVYAFIVNFSFNGSAWFKAIVDNVTSFSTWLYIIPFTSIIFAQIVICANVYMLKCDYQVTRFRKFVSLISLRTFILAVLHVVIGGGEIWLYLFLSNGRHKSMHTKCTEDNECLRESNFFLILSGLWTGLYYFICSHATNRSIIFPVVQQWKLPQFKAKFLPLIKQCAHLAVWPTLCYLFMYFVFRSYIGSLLTEFLQLRLQTEDLTIRLYASVWIFATLYIVNMNLTRFFFELFLTEPFTYIDNVSLSEALLSNNIPILQHLACLDLYLLSKWSPQRRQALFVLSQPGAHALAWNSIFQPAVEILVEFVEVLNKAIENMVNKEEVKPSINQNEISAAQRILHTPVIPSPMLNKYTNMNNMSALMRSPQDVDNVVQVTVDSQHANFAMIFDAAIKSIIQSLNKLLQMLQNLRFVKFLFGELPEAHIQQCLRNGQLIVWTSQGLANIAVASFHEDPYGIVQKDLSILIKVLFEIKQSIDKLNKLPMFTRRMNGFDYFTFKMKNSVGAGVRLSLGNLYNKYGKYINDIPLPRDIVYQLQNYV